MEHIVLLLQIDTYITTTPGIIEQVSYFTHHNCNISFFFQKHSLKVCTDSRKGWTTSIAVWGALNLRGRTKPVCSADKINAIFFLVDPLVLSSFFLKKNT